MPSVRDLYDQSIKPLSLDDREELIGLILDDLSPEPPNTVRSLAELEQALMDGLNSGPATPMTASDWDDIRRAAKARAAATRDRQTFNHA